MKQLQHLNEKLKPGKTYRRSDLAKWSKSVDRHVRELVEKGVLKKLQNGLYYHPKESVFGSVPPEEQQLVRAFLKDDNFLLTSPNSYNSLGLGTTQLYNTMVVYNQKRHGQFKLGGRTFDFQRKYNFPKKLSEEFLLVDLMNNLDSVAEDHEQLKVRVKNRAQSMGVRKLKQNVEKYGKVSTRKFFEPVLTSAH
jgi:hypothetical protein